MYGRRGRSGVRVVGSERGQCRRGSNESLMLTVMSDEWLIEFRWRICASNPFLFLF